jgi:hypothetical protein
MHERIKHCREWLKGFPVIQRASENPKLVLYGIAVLLLTTWLLIRAKQFLTKPTNSRSATPDLEKPASRNFKGAQRKPGGLYDPAEFSNSG